MSWMVNELRLLVSWCSTTMRYTNPRLLTYLLLSVRFARSFILLKRINVSSTFSTIHNKRCSGIDVLECSAAK